MSPNQASRNPSLKAFPRYLDPTWHWLTDPAETIQDPEQRRQARLLASFLVFMMVLTMVSNIVQLLTVPGFASTFKVLIGAATVLAITYGLSRTEYYRLGACITAALPSTVVFVNVFTNPADIITYAFIIIGVLICSIFCSIRVTATLAGANIIGILLLPALNPTLFSLADSAGPLSFIIIASALILVATHHRNQLEMDRQAALAENEERFRQITENISEVFWMASPEMQSLLYVSPSYEQIWRRSCQSLYEQPASFLEAIHPQDRERVMFAVEKRVREEYVKGQYSVEYRIIQPDGAERWILDRAFPIRAQTGEVYRVVGAARDVTERKLAEEALQNSESYFRSLIENALDMVIVINSDRTIRYISTAIERILNYKVDDLIGRDAFDFVHPDDLQSMLNLFSDISQSKEPSLPVEVRIRHRDGSIHTLETVANNLLNDPVMAGVVVNARDITERKRLEEQFLQSQKMEAIGRLAGGVAHDFNNLLTVITGYSELALSQLRDGRDLSHRDIEQIQKAAERAAALTRQLLAFSRQQMLQPRVLNLNDVITEIKEMLGRLIGADIELVTFLDKQLGPVKVDKGQIEQVVLNLVINARDAMPHGGTLTIETANIDLDEEHAGHFSRDQAGPWTMLAISDTGVGMGEATILHILEPFFTTKETGEGTGLGLATVHGIITQSGGQIQVDSEIEQGSSFKVFLPRVDEAVNEIEREFLSSESLHGTETILVVEDEGMVKDLVCQTLARYGYTVLEANDGMEALQIFQQHQLSIQLLLTDLVMPGGLNGRQLAERIISLRPDIKVLYISGYSDDMVVKRGLLDSNASFLQKPFSPQSLVHKLREVLELP